MWHAGPAGIDAVRDAHRRRSRPPCATTRIVLPLVAPLRHSSSRERDQKCASPGALGRLDRLAVGPGQHEQVAARRHRSRPPAAARRATSPAGDRSAKPCGHLLGRRRRRRQPHAEPAGRQRLLERTDAQEAEVERATPAAPPTRRPRARRPRRAALPAPPDAMTGTRTRSAMARGQGQVVAGARPIAVDARDEQLARPALDRLARPGHGVAPGLLGGGHGPHPPCAGSARAPRRWPRPPTATRADRRGARPAPGRAARPS